MPNDPRQPMGGQPHYVDDRQMNQPTTAQVQGEPMTPQAQHQAEIARQVQALQERANVLRVALPQLVHLQDTGQVQNPLPVPQEFRDHLARTQQTVTSVQRQAPQPPQVPEGMEDHPLLQQQPAPPQAQAAPSQQIAPQGPPIVDNASMMQSVPPQQERFAADLVADQDLMMGVAPAADASDYELAEQHITQPMQATQAPPPQKVTAKGGNIGQLKNPLWNSVDNLLLWESFYYHLIDADRHLLNNPDGLANLKKRLAQYQNAVDEKGLWYLEEIEKRARWRSLLTRNRINFGWNPVQVATIVNEYQLKLGKVTAKATEVPRQEEMVVVNDDPDLLVDEGPAAVEEVDSAPAAPAPSDEAPDGGKEPDKDEAK